MEGDVSCSRPMSTDSCISSTLSRAILSAPACCQDSICNLAFTFSPKLSVDLARTKFPNPTSVCWPTVHLIPSWNAFLLSSIYLYFWQLHGGSKITLKAEALWIGWLVQPYKAVKTCYPAWSVWCLCMHWKEMASTVQHREGHAAGNANARLREQGCLPLVMLKESHW